MEGQIKNKMELINGITHDAEQEAQRLVEQAKKDVEDKKRACDTQVESLLNEAEKKAQAQTEAIIRHNRSAVNVEIRRIALKKRGEVLKKVLERVEERFAKLIAEPGYKELLMHWIVEAAIGLNAEQAVVNASKKERPLVTAEVLRTAEQKVKSFINKKVELTVSDEAEPLVQGVILFTRDKKMAFNNQLPTRLLRYQSEIRKMIFDALFKDIGEE
ncbi:MAG: V-type ATP synthase subunit E family protein [Spirochaetia bacterium]